jgi:hypothetical protein
MPGRREENKSQITGRKKMFSSYRLPGIPPFSGCIDPILLYIRVEKKPVANTGLVKPY